MVQIAVVENTILLSGELKVDSVPEALNQCQQILSQGKHRHWRFDLANLVAIDSAGVAFLDELKSIQENQGRIIELDHVPPSIQSALMAFSLPSISQPALGEKPGLFETLGEQALRFKHHLLVLLLLIADIFYWSLIGLFQRKGQREGAFVQQSLLIGVNALQIVALLSFLIGLILALQSAAQLRQFGANIFVADLIGIAMLKEMGPIMTAIIVAGRSGSAIAAELATMVVTEEIDALKTMSLNPIRYVIVPKFHGITLTMPLLTILSDLIGILGGLVVAIVYLQLSAAAFMNELLTVLVLKDVLTGLLKSIVFAWIIIIVACYHGLKVSGGAEGVGKATTASVVASIFWVIVADSILGLIFYFE